MREKLVKTEGALKITTQTYYAARCLMEEGYNSAALLDAAEDREYCVSVPGYGIEDLDKHIKSWAKLVAPEQIGRAHV